jgi:hypothetical protein
MAIFTDVEETCAPRACGNPLEHTRCQTRKAKCRQTDADSPVFPHSPANFALVGWAISILLGPSSQVPDNGAAEIVCLACV